MELLEIADGSRRKVRCESVRRSLGYADLSPDGRSLTFTRPLHAGNPADDVWLLDLGRGTERPVTTDAAIDSHPMWTPDGRAIAFSSNRNGTWGVFTVPVRDGVPSAAPELVRDLGRSRPSLLGFTRDSTLFIRMMTDLEDALRGGLDLSAPTILDATPPAGLTSLRSRQAHGAW